MGPPCVLRVLQGVREGAEGVEGRTERLKVRLGVLVRVGVVGEARQLNGTISAASGWMTLSGVRYASAACGLTSLSYRRYASSAP